MCIPYQPLGSMDLCEATCAKCDEDFVTTIVSVHAGHDLCDSCEDDQQCFDVDAVQDRINEACIQSESDEAEAHHLRERAYDRADERKQIDYEDTVRSLADAPLLTGTLEDDIELLAGHDRRIELRG